ncbi:DUF4390 domain-containing protein [Candidatus Manganitrophus noduliformans]|uniref:DUF4390 domain-containing protein n=1 Tax=Candidatus Manganitrophus noduliformans TaxID=2606439 RepID=A0A7X6I9F2_9BACT|nr:DUF4390 domain-containing protein [Candidatus Manganitrophus noduliformans]NKE69413.1 DUF4390 domain-containing protein [Candidatus Manganitrophus noduliformans]
MTKKMWFISFFLILLVVPEGLFAAGSERIRNVVTEVKNQEIVVTAELVDGFNREIIRDIHDGIPKDFYYYLLLKRKQKNWFDEEILAKTIRYTVKYDTLKKKYAVVQREGERTVENTVDDLETMKRIVSKIDQVKLAPVSVLKSRNRYYVSVKSQMKAAKLPFYVDYFLFFIPFLEIDTPWADSDSLSVIR